MDAKTRAFHVQLIRLCKGIIKAWEAYVSPPSAQYPSAGLTPEAPCAPAESVPQGQEVRHGS